MRAETSAAVTLALLLGLAAPTRAQSQTSETARKHLESGIQFFEHSMYKQGLNDFEIVVSIRFRNTLANVSVSDISLRPS